MINAEPLPVLVMYSPIIGRVPKRESPWNEAGHLYQQTEGVLAPYAKMHCCSC